MPVTAKLDLGCGGFSSMPTMRSPADLGHAEALGVVHFLEQNVRARGLLAETVRRVPDIALDDVVAEDHADLVAVGEVLGQPQGVGDAAFAFLVGVVDVLEAELFAVGQQAQEIAGIAPAGDDQNVADAGIDQRLDRVIDHRLVIDRQQVLVGDFGKRKQTASRAASQNDAFHKLSS